MSRFTAAIVLALALGSPAVAQTSSPLTVEAPTLRATPGGAKVAAGYAGIINNGTEPDRLIGGKVPFAGRVEVHEMTMTDGVMKMRALPSGLEVPAGGKVVLQPGGNHLMFLDVTAPLKQGDVVQGTLLFQKAGDVPVTFHVGGLGPPTAMRPAH